MGGSFRAWLVDCVRPVEVRFSTTICQQLLDKNSMADDRWQKIFCKEIVMVNSKQYYRDFREHLKAMEERGKLIRIKREIDKDTELMPLVRWQFRGLEEAERKAFLFENVVDAKSKKYTM